MAQCLLTTMDNPWHPFKHPDQWLNWDSQFYNTTGLIAYYNEASSLMDDEDYEFETNQAIDFVLREINPFGNYFKVYETDGYDIIKLANEAYAKANANKK